MVRSVHPDVILLDLMMPRMNGFEVLEALEADEELRRIPVVVVTAKTLTESERKRLGSYVQALLEKGDFTDRELLRRVLGAIGEGD